jgi:hypothetical protein
MDADSQCVHVELSHADVHNMNDNTTDITKQ